MINGFRRSRLKYSIDENFFDNWTSQMAYVLGFTFADGNIHRTSLSWDIQMRDLTILKKINKVLNSNYPIKLQRKRSYRLRINNQSLIEGALKVGLLPRKSMRLVFPRMPRNATRHFLRGYLDGDGWISRRMGRNEVDLGFSCGNNKFLKNIAEVIQENLGITGRVRENSKITPNGFKSTTYSLEYYTSNAIDIADWLYGDLESGDIYLKRKYAKYLRGKAIYEQIWVKFRSKRIIQRALGKPLKDILVELYKSERLNGMQIAKSLGTSKSSVYRWLEMTGVKYLN